MCVESDRRAELVRCVRALYAARELYSSATRDHDRAVGRAEVLRCVRDMYKVLETYYPTDKNAALLVLEFRFIAMSIHGDGDPNHVAWFENRAMDYLAKPGPVDDDVRRSCRGTQAAFEALAAAARRRQAGASRVRALCSRRCCW